jgi:hypothetical protein
VTSGPLGLVGPLAPEHVQARAAAMMEACAAAKCRYADSDARGGCDGYEAHVYVEDGSPVLRWRRCPRFRVWWRDEKVRLENRRAAETRAKRGRAVPREWSDE